MNPPCPPDYSCSFTLLHPRVITHTVGPWWHGGGGLAIAILLAIALPCVLAYVSYLVSESRKDLRTKKDNELGRQAKLELEKQRTMQMDMAKGNPEMLKIVREQYYG